MDNYLSLYDAYRKASSYEVIKHIYTNASKKYKTRLWSAKIFFIIGSILQFTNYWIISLFLIAGSALLIIDSFKKSITEIYQSSIPSLRIKSFYRNYQYLRYIKFAESVSQSTSVNKIDDALLFLQNLLDTESKESLFNHPVISLLIAGLLAVIGGAAGSWDNPTIIKVVTTICILSSFCSMILGSLQSKEQKLLEFQRFLYWLKSSV